MKRFSGAERPRVRYLIRRTPPYVPALLSTIGPMHYPLPGYSTYPF